MTSSESAAYNKLLSVIKQKCLECSGGKTEEVRDCALVPVYQKRTLVQGCSLWPFRLGLATKEDERKLKRARSAYEKALAEAA